MKIKEAFESDWAVLSKKPFSSVWQADLNMFKPFWLKKTAPERMKTQIGEK